MEGSCGEVAYVDEPAVVFLSRVGSRPTLNNKLGAFPFRIESGKKHFKSAMECTYQIVLFDVPRCKAVLEHTELG